VWSVTSRLVDAGEARGLNRSALSALCDRLHVELARVIFGHIGDDAAYEAALQPEQDSNELEVLRLAAALLEDLRATQTGHKRLGSVHVVPQREDEPL
jgi:hypothetical protein